MLPNGKIAVHLYAPVLSLSGYGTFSRQVIDYLLSDERFVVFLQNVPWGGCPFVHDTDLLDSEQFKKYYNAIATFEQNKSVEYDISIYVTIPSEYERKARFCIGMTAGIEVDRCTAEWIKRCNMMDLIVVPSHFSKQILTETSYLAKNPQTNEEFTIKLEKPVHVVPHYFEQTEKQIPDLNLNFESSKNLLFVGLWGNKGSFGEDRKNVADLIRLFLLNFGDNPDYGLVLKTSIITNTPQDKEEVIKRVKQIKENVPEEKTKAKIYLIHESLTDLEMMSLYRNKNITGMITLTHGEGFGLPLLDAHAAGLPVLATNWSGHLDFLRPKNGFIPFEYEMVEIPECQVWDKVIDKGSRWARVFEDDFKKRTKKFLESPGIIKKQASENVNWLKDNFSKNVVFDKWKNFYDLFIKTNTAATDASGMISEEDAKVMQSVQIFDRMMMEVSEFASKYDIDITDKSKKRVLYVMPQSFGDVVISTSVVNSLIQNRHNDDEFYFATKPQYKEILKGLSDEYGVKVVDYDEKMMHCDFTKYIWDYVYNPGINVQYIWSNWTIGNGDFGVRLLEEFAKNCNIPPRDVCDYKISPEKFDIPTNKTIISITPVSMKQSKSYKYWNDIVYNLKKMSDDIEVVQLGDHSEKLIEGCLDCRGLSFNKTMYVVKRSLVHIAPDTGTGHVAAALRVPHILLFASTSPNQCSPVLFDKGVKQIVLEALESCESKCYKDICCKTKDGINCISKIDARTICETIYSVIKEVNIKDEK